MALNNREKAMLTLPFLLGGMMSFYNWVHEPLFVRREDARTKLEQVQTDLKRDQSKLQREGDLAARLSAVTNREQLIDSWVPGKNSAALFVWYLSQAELYSGARIRSIKVSERKEVVADSGAGTQAATGARPAGAGGEQSQQPQGPAATLTMIRLDLTVDARFAEHLLFNQQIEQMPLFLNTHALSLTRGEKLPVDKVNALLLQGNALLAEQLLSQSPAVDGTYSVNLYFKNRKPGPSTEAMQFGTATGRTDPFVMDGVAEFIEFVLDHYANPGQGSEPGLPGQGRGFPNRQGPRSGQMG